MPGAAERKGESDMAEAETKTALQVSGLTVSYEGRNTPVLKDLAFSLDAGTSLAVLGPNGCGKTTLLRALLGILPGTGKIEILGRKLSSMKRREIACCAAHMSQLFSTGFAYSVRETVAMGRYARDERNPKRDREAVDRCLEETGLMDLADRPVTSLSGGQLQRVFFARTLAQETPVILLDEPTSSLDMRFQEEFCELLSKWRKGTTRLPDGSSWKNTLIGVYHDPDLALEISDEILFLKDGRILAKGPKEDVLSGRTLREVYGMDVPAWKLRNAALWESLSDSGE